MNVFAIAPFIFANLVAQSSFAAPTGEGISRVGLCPSWGTATDTGSLDATIISEASGLAVSRRFNKLYHVNDSGDGPRFYVTERDGSGTRSVTIRGFKPWDVEEIALGPCPVQGEGSCLVIADIGDNRARRKHIEILFVKEEADWPEEVDVVHRLWLKYPDKAHDAESIAILPNKDIVIVTKEQMQLKNAYPAHVFRLRAPYVETTNKKPAVLQSLGKLDVPAMVADKSLGAAVTAMSVSSDGKRVALLTYDKAVEIAIDLTAKAPKLSALKRDKDYSVIRLDRLYQQEGVSYDTNENDLIYTSESVMRIVGTRRPVPFRQVKCLPAKVRK